MVSKYDLNHPFPLESRSFLLPYDTENKIINFNILSQVYDKIVTKLKVEGVHCNLCSPCCTVVFLSYGLSAAVALPGSPSRGDVTCDLLAEPI